MGIKEFIPFFQEDDKKKQAVTVERRSEVNKLKDML